MKFDHGQRVACYIKGTVVRDARISVDSGRMYVCQNFRAGSSCKEMFGYKHSWLIGVDWCEGEHDVTQLHPLDGFRCFKGDVIINTIKDRALVMFANEYMFVRSEFGEFESIRSAPFTHKSAERNGWKIESVEPIEENMVDVDGKKISVSTIKEALKQYVA